MNRSPSTPRGFTLVEIGVALAILAILTVIAVPSYRDSVDKSRLRAAVEALHADLQNARSTTQQQKAAVTAVFSTGTSWCYGITATKPTCSCAQVDPAQADFCELRVVRAADVKNATLTAADFGGSPFTSFEPVRGTATAGSVTVTSGLGKIATISVSALGRVATCSPAGAGNTDLFPAC